jgi:hypothetical protein
VIEPALPGTPLNATPETLKAAEPPVVAFVGPAVPAEEFPESHVASADPRARGAAVRALTDTLPWLSAVRCRRLVATVGAAGLAGEDALRKKLSAGDAEPRSILRAAREGSSTQRQAHAEFVCRAIFELRRLTEGVRLLLLPTDDPLSFLDPETADWILGSVKGTELAIDTGAVLGAEVGGGTRLSDWFGRPASSLGLILLADHDGRGDGALLPGAGRADFARLRDVIGPGVPHAVRCDPRAGFDDVLASCAETARRLGPIGDPTAW